MKITLKDGKQLECESGISLLQIAKQISQGLAKKSLVAKVNGQLHDLSFVLNTDAQVEYFTFEDAEGKNALRHTASHILAQAVQRLYPDVKLAIGPAIENGFYYDFDIENPFTSEELKKIEKEMQKIIDSNLLLERVEVSREEAVRLMNKAGELYKIELVNELPEDALITFYRQGDFVDLCAGPHLVSTNQVKAFKLLQVAGAYWRGSEKNKMLQRIYGTAFSGKEALEEYLNMLEEAARRDHRKLGRELDLFSIQDEGPGFPFFHPKGMVLRNALENYWHEVHSRYGYDEIKTPIILNKELWHQSGHWDHYRDNMYFTTIDEGEYAIKPMNCPGAMLIYRQHHFSYRDLPLRWAELGLVHRHELSGALHGLMRVRCFTQDDAHITMLPSQVKKEIMSVVDLFEEVYSTFGLTYHAELSTKPEGAMGTDEIWEIATESLRSAMDERGMKYRVNEGDGAFYGPKIDFHLRDSIGRTWQCGTIQLDMLMPEKFDLTYIGEDGKKHRPVMIHRVVYGSLERFIGILIEHFAGAFPVWLAPVQVKVMPITDRSLEYSHTVVERLKRQGIRVELDSRNEKIGYKIRQAQMEKIPYMLVIGDKEAEAGEVAVRQRGQNDIGTMSLEVFIERVLKDNVDRIIW
ncbi:MAG: threonine--tRNA ligase [Negativicutes bacterium]